MKLRLVPVGIACLIVLVAVQAFIEPTAAQLRAARARVADAQARLSAVSARGTVAPRILAQRHALAARLQRERAMDDATAEGHLLADLTAAAASCGVTLSSFSAKGAAVPLGADPARTQPVASAGPPGPPDAARADAPVPGLRLARSVTIDGSLSGILRFVDRIGDLREPVRLDGIALAQRTRLQATIDFDVLVIDQATLREAQG
jgi:hypothetical protein